MEVHQTSQLCSCQSKQLQSASWPTAMYFYFFPNRDYAVGAVSGGVQGKVGPLGIAVYLVIRYMPTLSPLGEQSDVGLDKPQICTH